MTLFDVAMTLIRRRDVVGDPKFIVTYLTLELLGQD